MEIWQIVLLGIYTLAYIIVIIIQQKRIDSMKTFMNIFDLDKVQKYVEISEKAAKLQYENLLADNEKMKEIAMTVVKEEADNMKQFYFDSLKKKNIEMAMALVKLLKVKSDEEIVKFSNQNLPIMKDIIFKGVKSYGNIFDDENTENDKG